MSLNKANRAQIQFHRLLILLLVRLQQSSLWSQISDGLYSRRFQTEYNNSSGWRVRLWLDLIQISRLVSCTEHKICSVCFCYLFALNVSDSVGFIFVAVDSFCSMFMDVNRHNNISITFRGQCQFSVIRLRVVVLNPVLARCSEVRHIRVVVFFVRELCENIIVDWFHRHFCHKCIRRFSIDFNL